MSATGVDEVRQAVRRIADSVLYEGYVLFPYRASATKNRYRWSFGVLVPDGQAALDPSETAELTSQLLLRRRANATVTVTVRALAPRRRQVEAAGPDGSLYPVDHLDVDGDLVTTWDEGVEVEESTGPLDLDTLRHRGWSGAVRVHAAESIEPLAAGGRTAGRIVRRTEAVTVGVEVRADHLDDTVTRVTTRVRNTTAWSRADSPRDEVLRRSLAGVHLVCEAEGAHFASAIDPPAWAARYVDACDNQHTHPVLVGPPGSDMYVLSAPIILPDHPEVAPESAGETFDATEIDELLSRCVAGLTDEEKRQARATDPRAAAIIERADTVSADTLDRLHGAIRSLRPIGTETPYAPGGPSPHTPAQPVDDEVAALLGVGEPPLQRVVDGDVEVAVGDRVRLEPQRRADAQDVFLTGRSATVHRIWQTVDGDLQVGVVLDDDPAADLHEWYGRYQYFHLDEISLLERGSP